MAFIERVSPAQIVQAVGLLAALAGVATWSSLLLTPAESRTPDVAPQRMAERSDNPALQWFSNQPAPVEIKVSGVMAGTRAPVAILSLNDGPPRSFLVGERVAQGYGWWRSRRRRWSSNAAMNRPVWPWLGCRIR